MMAASQVRDDTAPVAASPRHLPLQPPADLDLPPDVWTRLREEYDGVFDEAALRRHVRDHLGDDVAEDQLALVRRRTPHARRILDVASGWGSFVVAARVAGLDAVGVDLARPELEHARRRSAPVLRADAGALPLPPATFDVVTMWNVLEHVDDRVAVLAEAARVLVPDGSLYVEAPNYRSFRREAHYHVPWLPGLHGRLAERWLVALRRDPTFFRTSVRPCSWSQVAAELRGAGFDVGPMRDEKLRDPASIRRPGVRRAVEIAIRFGFGRVIAALLAADARNPLQASIRLHAVKRG